MTAHLSSEVQGSALAGLANRAISADNDAPIRCLPRTAAIDPVGRERMIPSMAADDLCGPSYPENLNDPSYLVEQIASPVILAGFRQYHRRQETGVDLLQPAGKFRNPLCCNH